jgi:hypothetical protein
VTTYFTYRTAGSDSQDENPLWLSQIEPPSPEEIDKAAEMAASPPVQLRFNRGLTSDEERALTDVFPGASGTAGFKEVFVRMPANMISIDNLAAKVSALSERAATLKRESSKVWREYRAATEALNVALDLDRRQAGEEARQARERAAMLER